MVPVGDQSRLQLVVSVTEVLTRPCARCTAFDCIPHLQILGIVAKVDVARQILPIRCELQQEFFPFFLFFPPCYLLYYVCQIQACLRKGSRFTAGRYSCDWKLDPLYISWTLQVNEARLYLFNLNAVAYPVNFAVLYPGPQSFH